MPQNNRKIKLTKMLELLRSDSDLEHPLTTKSFIEKLAVVGVHTDRQYLARDVAILNEQGFEVMTTKVGSSNAYYIEDRRFSIPELKILIDAVQASGFITEKKSQELIDKIAVLGGSHQAEILKDSIVHFNTRKHSNECIYYNVGALEEAIRKKQKIIFYYYDINENKKKVYRRDKHHYVIEPLALVFHEDNYYVMTYDSRFDNTTNYRVDRMEQIEIIDEPVSEETLSKVNISEYTEKTFKMYNGTTDVVTLSFEDSLISAVYDKFGEDSEMSRTEKHICQTTVEVNVSPTFFGWLFQFAGRMRVVSPTEVAEQYKEICRKAQSDHE